MPRRERRIASIEPLKDERRRPGDRHKVGRKHSGPKKTKWERKLIVAWDGEGANREDGTHIYNLIANSEGTRLFDKSPDGLSTRSVLDFFIKYGNPNAINVIYGGSYDVNMLLKDVPPDKIKELWIRGDTYWEDYRIFYAPRKKLTVQKFYLKGEHLVDKHTFTLWDVLGYFQSTFVVACRKWLGDLPVLDDIESMKFERNVFTEERLDEIVEYNRKECELLVKLMEALFDALDSVGIQLIRYDGAGSIAAALLKANNVRSHKGEPNEEVLRWAQYAYSGGRIEAPKIGAATVPVYRNDINSAYPSACLDLPSYTKATWTFDKEWDGQDCSMVHIAWTYSSAKRKRQPFYPLWYREYDGTILYPSRGEGVYWGVEVRNVIKYQDPSTYEILGACNVHLATDVKPFAFLSDMYHARLVLKQSGNMASEAFKLGMNSIYGKLAQQVGFRNGRIPTYHQLLWAGQITASIRAQLYDAAMQHPKSVIAFATDALITTEPLDLPTSDKLGEWTYDRFEGITIVQPGVYWLKGAEGWYDKYRGFDKGSLLREHIIGCWLMGQDFTAQLTRFVGMGSALASSDFHRIWRSWDTQERVLSLTPSGKRMENKDDVCYWSKLCDTLPTINTNFDGLLSKPYPLLWVDDEDGLKSFKEDKVLQIIEDELLDTFA